MDVAARRCLFPEIPMLHRRWLPCSVLVALSLGTATAAQGPILRAVVQTELRASISSGESRSTPVGTDVTGGVAEAVSSTCSNGPQATARYSVASAATAGAASCRFVTQAVSAGCFFGSRLGRASGAIDIDLSAPTSRRGSIRVRVEPLAFLTIPGTFRVQAASGRFDIDESVIVAPGAWEMELPFELGPTPERVRVSAAVAPGLAPLAEFNDIAVTFADASSARLLLAGSSCGPRLDARLVQRDLTLSASNIPDWQASFFVFGTVDPSTPIPPTNCLLRSDLLVTIPAPRDPTGNTEQTIPIPAALNSLQMRVQHLAGRIVQGVSEWQTSEALRIRL